MLLDILFEVESVFVSRSDSEPRGRGNKYKLSPRPWWPSESGQAQLHASSHTLHQLHGTAAADAPNDTLSQSRWPWSASPCKMLACLLDLPRCPSR